jgi:GTP-binding protein
VKVASEFVTSAAGAAGFPKDGLPELAMVGRSNVGKSTLINALVRQKLARTSAAPGKTRLANFYRVAAEGRPPFFLVDLPGYGYARGGDKTREEFDQLAAEYFGDRKRGRASFPEAPEETKPVPFFAGVLVLVDSRHPGLDADRSAWNWLGRLGVERHVVATKLDKLTRAERQRHLRELERMYSGPVTPVSAQTGEGLDELWKMIARLLTQP